MILRDNHKITLRFNNFEQTLKAFKILSKVKDLERGINFRV